jgi:small subunit ribosomal protein S1
MIMADIIENEDLFEQMLNDYLPEDKKKGDMIEATIMRKDTEFSYLDLNNKLEGRILTRELENYNIGDKIDVKVIRTGDENIIVSKFLLDREKEFASYEESEMLTGEITKKVKGGYTVKIGKNEAFLPFSLSAIGKDEDCIGKKYKFLVKEKSRNSIKLSRIDLVKKEEEEFIDSLNVGDIVLGKVKQILDFGLVLDLGKITGFVHISEISWEQVSDLIKMFELNQEIKAVVIEKEKEKNKIKLSIKRLTENPWNIFLSKNSVGDVVSIVIKEKLDFGLVVEKDMANGFVHISELSWTHNAEMLNSIEENQIIEAKIIEIDEKKNNVKYSLKQIHEDPWNVSKEKYIVGQIFENKIEEVFEFGLLVELEKDIEGLIHVSDLSYRRINDVASKYKKGDIIKSKVIGFNDEKRRISLSVKSILDDIWASQKEDTLLGETFKGKVVNIQEYGMFVEMENGFEIFIHKNEFSWDRDESIEFSIGDEVEFKIISVELAEKKLAGSIKQLTISPWKEAEELYKIGNKVKTTIIEIQENAVLVKLTDRLSGVVPKRELSKEFIKNISDSFSVGQEVEGIITEFNEKRKSVLLSIKRIEEIEDSKELEELLKIYGV